MSDEKLKNQRRNVRHWSHRIQSLLLLFDECLVPFGFFPLIIEMDDFTYRSIRTLKWLATIVKAFSFRDSQQNDFINVDFEKIFSIFSQAIFKSLDFIRRPFTIGIWREIVLRIWRLQNTYRWFSQVIDETEPVQGQDPICIVGVFEEIFPHQMTELKTRIDRSIVLQAPPSNARLHSSRIVFKYSSIFSSPSSSAEEADQNNSSTGT